VQKTNSNIALQKQKIQETEQECQHLKTKAEDAAQDSEKKQKDMESSKTLWTVGAIIGFVVAGLLLLILPFCICRSKKAEKQLREVDLELGEAAKDVWRLKRVVGNVRQDRDQKLGALRRKLKKQEHLVEENDDLRANMAVLGEELERKDKKLLMAKKEFAKNMAALKELKKSFRRTK